MTNTLWFKHHGHLNIYIYITSEYQAESYQPIFLDVQEYDHKQAYRSDWLIVMPCSLDDLFWMCLLCHKW